MAGALAVICWCPKPFVEVLAMITRIVAIAITILVVATPVQAQQIAVTDLSAEVWVRTLNTDKMTGRTGWAASIWSVERLQIQAPAEPHPLMLNVGKTPGGEVYALVGVVNGHFWCRDCDMRVRFDQDEPEVWSGTSSVQQSQLLYLRRADRFIERARAAKTVTVEVPLFQHGKAPVTFRSAGLPSAQ